MIIPIKCFTCGNVIANKYRYYLAEVRKRKLVKSLNTDDINIEKVIYLTKEFHEKTIEGEVLDELKLNKIYFIRHMLTHVVI